jgi:hypothetical protein
VKPTLYNTLRTETPQDELCQLGVLIPDNQGARVYLTSLRSRGPVSYSDHKNHGINRKIPLLSLDLMCSLFLYGAILQSLRND